MNIQEFTEPHRHWIIESLLPDSMLAAAMASLPPPQHSNWVRYNNDCERNKRTLRPQSSLIFTGPSWQQLLSQMTTDKFVDYLSNLVGIHLTADLHWYGSGIHVTDPGGWLNCHLDYALHPESKMERRINLTLFLNKQWKEEWGGTFEMYNASARKVVKRIHPGFNRAIVWEAGDLSYHGTEQVADDAESRITAAVYYLAQPRPNCTRQRALYVPRR